MSNEEDNFKLLAYKLRLELLEERLNVELRAKDREIEIYKGQIDYLQNLVIILSQRSIVNNNILEAKAVADQSKSETRNVNFNAPIQGTGYVEGDQPTFHIKTVGDLNTSPVTIHGNQNSEIPNP